MSVTDVTTPTETFDLSSVPDPLETKVRSFEIPEKMAPFAEPCRFKIAYGGRGSAKSHTIARLLLLAGRNHPSLVLCARENMNSISDSVHKILSDLITEMGFDDFYKVNKAEIIGINGTRFIFKGLRHNPTEIKSTEGIDICWVEEAEKVSRESWDILIPTVRRPGSEIWISFNPRHSTDPTYQRFIVNTPPNAVVVRMNWRDNPWFPEVLKEEMEYDRSTDFAKYLHVWEGKTREEAGDSVFKPEWDQVWKPLPHDAKGMNILILVDPANSKAERADYTVFTVIGLNKDRGIYIFEWHRDRLDVFERIAVCFELVQKYGDYGKPTVYWEAPAMSDDTVHVKAKQIEVGYRFPVYPIKPRGKKEDRISALIPYFAELRVFTPEKQMFRQKDGKIVDLQKVFKQEKDAFPSIPGTMHDDMMDSLAILTYPEVPKNFPNSSSNMRNVTNNSIRQKKTYDPLNLSDDYLDKIML